MSETTSFSIAIVGGGLGGLFAALCIHHHCASSSISKPIKIDVYEQAAEYKEIGAGIAVGISAVRLVDELGLLDDIYAIAGTRPGSNATLVYRRFDSGDEIFRMPVPKPGDVQVAACARTALLDLFKTAVERRGAATLHTRKACQGVEDGGEHVVLSFADGTTARADLVIACDGIHSAIRDQFIADPAVYSGQVAYRDVIPRASLGALPDNGATMWLAKHKHLLVYPISRGEEFNFVAFVDQPEREARDVRESWVTTCERAEVQAAFAEHEEGAQAILRALSDRPAKWRINDREPLDQWHFMGGKVMLLGDAAHAMLPHLGAGCSQSMEDGWVLGRALSDHFRGGTSSRLPTLEAVASLYQAARLPRAQKTQTASRAVGKVYGFQAEDLVDLPFDDCCPLIAGRVREAMMSSWYGDVDVGYENERAKRTSN